MLPRSEQLLKTQFWAGEVRFVLLDEFPGHGTIGLSTLHDVRYPLCYCIAEGAKVACF